MSAEKKKRKKIEWIRITNPCWNHGYVIDPMCSDCNQKVEYKITYSGKPPKE